MVLLFGLLAAFPHFISTYRKSGPWIECRKELSDRDPGIYNISVYISIIQPVALDNKEIIELSGTSYKSAAEQTKN